MPSSWLQIRGSDSLLFRDGRPFSAEPGALAASTLPLPYPSTVAGMFRTRLGTLNDWNWNDPEIQKQALATELRGPILCCNSKPVFAAPADAVIYKPTIATTTEMDSGVAQVAVMRLRPRAEANSGCDLPGDALRPLAITEDVKPESGYSYWDEATLLNWLETSGTAPFTPPAPLSGPLRESRVHVGIKTTTGTSEDGKLFTAQFLAFDQDTRRLDGSGEERQWSLQVHFAAEKDLTGMVTLGGERRLAVVEHAVPWAECPQTLCDALKTTQTVRLMLATPALFDAGWRPDWLRDDLEGVVPGTTVRLRLVSAAVKRREAISGWDHRVGNFRGPKPVRWLVPAGSVYFFEVVAGDPSQLATVWLHSICTALQAKRDGFGLALWGI